MLHHHVPVDGGHLHVLTWGSGGQVAVAVHGITGSAMSWQTVARELPPGWTLAAPDLRGRGHSMALPGPYGLNRHVEDVAAVLDHFGHPAVLAGHSLGANIALLTRDTYPARAGRLVLVEGGLPVPLRGAHPGTILRSSLSVLLPQLRRTFPDAEACLDFWRRHPALAGYWTEDLADNVRYHLVEVDGHLRSRTVEQAIRADSRDLLRMAGRFNDALLRLADPAPLLIAPAGTAGAANGAGAAAGLYSSELVAVWQQRARQLCPQLIPEVNHCTILFAPAAARTVAGKISGD